jgi:Flp pilus assembly protein TadD
MPLALSRPKLWIGLAVASLGGACLAGGWWLGHLQSGGQATDPKQRALERQLEGLQQRSAQGGASAAEEQRLLELLIALNRKDEALSLSERLADQQPERPALRLVLAELRRDQNDRSGAEREVRQLLNQNPNNIEALQLMALLQVESGRGALAVSQLQAAFDQASKPAVQSEGPQPEAPKSEALDIGLLLANVLQRQGQPGQAEALLIRLAAAFPKDQTPILARALLLQERGNTRGAQAAIAQAKALKPGQENPRLDAIAAAWGLESLKDPSPGGSRSSKPGPAKHQGP